MLELSLRNAKIRPIPRKYPPPPRRPCRNRVSRAVPFPPSPPVPMSTHPLRRSSAPGTGEAPPRGPYPPEAVPRRRFGAPAEKTVKKIFKTIRSSAPSPDDTLQPDRVDAVTISRETDLGTYDSHRPYFRCKNDCKQLFGKKPYIAPLLKNTPFKNSTL